MFDPHETRENKIVIRLNFFIIFPPKFYLLWFSIAFHIKEGEYYEIF
tara:strand:- start:1614 stop:1754 length:141 start_codon:yes stop_codon:yes gene_type:complete